MAEVSLTAPAAQSTEVWKSLSQWLPGRNPDDEFWWKLCGHHLATMLEAAGYSVQKQYDSLIFFYQWMVSWAYVNLAWKSLQAVETMLTISQASLFGPGSSIQSQAQMEDSAWSRGLAH